MFKKANKLWADWCEGVLLSCTGEIINYNPGSPASRRRCVECQKRTHRILHFWKVTMAVTIIVSLLCQYTSHIQMNEKAYDGFLFFVFPSQWKSVWTWFANVLWTVVIQGSGHVCLIRPIYKELGLAILNSQYWYHWHGQTFECVLL